MKTAIFRNRWFAGIILGLYLSLAAATDPVDVSRYQVIINEVDIQTTLSHGFAGDETIMWVEVDYTLIVPGGAEIEHPAGEDLPVKVEFEYQWIWITNLDYYNKPIEELVIATKISEDRYRVIFTEPGPTTTKVIVTARVVLR